MSDIFVSYRRSCEGMVAALVARLRRHLGRDKVFHDLDLAPGARYPDELRERVRASTVVVVVIHAGWLTEFATPRATDWVILEIETALALGKPVIPLLLDDTPMPAAEHLPVEIRELATRNAERLRAISHDDDIERLVQRLLHHVDVGEIPPARPVATVPPRTIRGVAAWAALFFLVTWALLYDSAPLWENFAFPAFVSAVVMTLYMLTIALGVLVSIRFEPRWQRSLGTISHSQRMRREWLAPALLVLATSYVMVLSMTRNGLTVWRIWYVLAITTIAVFVLQRWWRKADPADREWPPPITTELMVFRRAAYRLDERLTTDPAWQFPRARAVQRQAVTIYLELTQVRVALDTRSTLPLADWLRCGFTRQTTIELGWFVSVVALDAVAAGIMIVHQAPAAPPWSMFGVTLGLAVLSAAGAVFAQWTLDRARQRRNATELGVWQQKLGPRIFCAHHAAGR